MKSSQPRVYYTCDFLDRPRGFPVIDWRFAHLHNILCVHILHARSGGITTAWNASVCQSANCFSQRVIVIQGGGCGDGPRVRPTPGSRRLQHNHENAISYFSRTIFHAACNPARYGRHPTRNHYRGTQAPPTIFFLLWPAVHALNNVLHYYKVIDNFLIFSLKRPSRATSRCLATGRFYTRSPHTQ